MRIIAERVAPDVAVQLTADEAAAAIRAGTPLLSAGRLAVDGDELSEEFRHVASNLAETTELGTPAHDTARRLAGAPLEVAPLLQPALSYEREAIDREAFRLQVDPAALAELLQLAIQPALWEARAQLETLTDIDVWDRGYCPVCGAWPTIAELVGAERRRVLRCVRCGAGWSWLVLLCPYCGNDDHRTLGTLASEDPKERVDVCERCHGYVKATATFSSHSPSRLVAEDVATVHLDLIATEAGYKRPGDVDVAIAGIPRLVREGRTGPPPD